MADQSQYLFGGLALFALFFLPITLPHYALVRRLIKTPFQWGQFIWFAVLSTCSWCANRLVILYANGWNVVSAILWYVPLLLWVFRVRGWRFFLVLMKLVLMLMCLELSCAVLVTLADVLGISPEGLMLVTLEDLHNPGKLLGSAVINLLGTSLLLLLLMAGQHVRYLHRTAPPELRKRRWHITISIARVLILLVAAISVLAMPHYLFGVSSITDFLLPNKERYLVMVLSVSVLIAVAFSYIIQDIRYLVQWQRLNTLEQQQAISRGLLENLRFFRHNIINMLYGLEGAMLSENKDKLEAYFTEIQKKCALVNNENIAALERVTNPSVSALLLHAVDSARQLSLPINLFVQEGILLPRVLGDADLCQIVGVLLDNAIEAANAAAERHVAVEMRSVENAVELIISNTYSGAIAAELLSRGGQSTKEGHEGQGLSSCYHIISRKRGVFLNFWITGQYVRAQLLLQR